MQRAFTAAIAIGALGIAAIPARAEPPQVAAASCVPVSGPYKVSSNKVSFKSGRTGTIVLHCQMNEVELAEADFNGLSMVVTYRDSGGGAATGQVKILLVGATKGLGNKTTVLQFNSNAAPAASGVTSAVGQVVPVITTDFYYLMRIELKRASTSQTVELYGFSYEAT
jgi:hypothetical protein